MNNTSLVFFFLFCSSWSPKRKDRGNDKTKTGPYVPIYESGNVFTISWSLAYCGTTLNFQRSVNITPFVKKKLDNEHQLDFRQKSSLNLIALNSIWIFFHPKMIIVPVKHITVCKSCFANPENLKWKLKTGVQ